MATNSARLWTVRLPDSCLRCFDRLLVCETMKLSRSLVCSTPVLVFSLVGAGIDFARAAADYEICVSNEKSGDITLVDGATRNVLATIPVGKRPRGIIASPDGKMVYVALSGTPISGPP